MLRLIVAAIQTMEIRPSFWIDLYKLVTVVVEVLELELEKITHKAQNNRGRDNAAPLFITGNDMTAEVLNRYQGQ